MICMNLRFSLSFMPMKKWPFFVFPGKPPSHFILISRRFQGPFFQKSSRSQVLLAFFHYVNLSLLPTEY